ncbi:MAG: hypothetical protein GWN01_01305 [Nitrosopumilaceae archaeon]|nr:hypothetical protein [Nitrosopumilaceae archaeon]NIU85996.1 hypothetical protein [Nitrosopumilaceae archaeon]NIX60215.1 hypothetical protein [Nitrosopumilaceae archaeon]
MVTVTLVSTFKRLNDDRTLAVKPNAASREREAIVDVTYGGSENYSTGGNTVDFSGLRQFSKVYAVDFLARSKGLLADFVPGTNDDAATGKIKLFGVDPGAAGGAIVALPELPDTSTETNSLVLRCRIRGV